MIQLSMDSISSNLEGSCEFFLAKICKSFKNYPNLWIIENEQLFINNEEFSILWEQSLDVHPLSNCDGFTAQWTDAQFWTVSTSLQGNNFSKKKFAIPCKSGRGEKHNISMSSVQLTRCPQPKANSFAFVKQIGQTYISKLGRK